MIRPLSVFFGFVLSVVSVVAVAQPVGARTIPALVTPSDGGVPWTAAERAALHSRLDALFVGSTAIRGAHVGIDAIDVRDGTPLYGRLPDDEFMPASTLKLLVGSAALAKLGTSFRFRTSAFLTQPVAGGVEPGSLVLRGGGDPLLRFADLDALAKTTLSGGVRSIAGGVTVDASYFDAHPYPAGWLWDDLPFYYAAKVSAASLEENVVHVIVTAGSHVGDRARLASNFPGSRLAMTDVGSDPVEPGCQRAGAALSVPGVITLWPSATTGRAGSDSTVDAARTPDGCTLIVGSVPIGGSDTVDPAVPSPEQYLQSASSELLRAHTIEVGDAAASATRSGDRLHYVDRGDSKQTIWTHSSDPLPKLLADMWFPSDNLLAECLLKALGVARNGTPGTTEHGTALEREWLRSIGVDTRTVTLSDGSGLSIYDRITPRDLVAILSDDWNAGHRRVVLDALPVAGVRGTLREEFVDTPAAGRAFVKTGSMTHVRGLAGFLQTHRHGAVAFALMVDDWNGDSDALNAFRGAVLTALLGT